MSKGKTKSGGRDKKGLEAKPVAELDESEAAAELKRLAKAITHHDELYYRLDTPEISDAAYDALRDRNAAIEGRFPRLIRDDSPTLRIGAPPVEAFGKIVHRVPMLSLSDVFDDEGFPTSSIASGASSVSQNSRVSPSRPSLRSTGSRSRSVIRRAGSCKADPRRWL